VQRYIQFNGQQKMDMMKKLFLLVIVCAVISCQKASQTEHNSLVGKWRMTESYADPGDGSGTWHPADPAHPGYLEFKTDGTLTFTPYNMYSANHYKITSDSTMLFIRATDTIPFRYIFSKTLLALYPPCYEGCGEKYIPAH